MDTPHFASLAKGLRMSSKIQLNPHFKPSSPNNEFSISVSNLSKTYTVYKRPEDRLKQMIIPRIQKLTDIEPSKYYQPFSALKDVSFNIPRGETVGILGRNGSGKSTLLQIICGTLNQTAGTVQVNGRIAALLELGAGFNREFTGRENVFLNATILGLSQQEIKTRFDAIAEFAEIDDFMDRPVKTYSSGMYMRLAFAVAINADPDILVVDEALSVGDEAFRRKCYARIEEIQSLGATILFVSHGISTILQLCSHAILLDQGELLMQGDPKSVTAQYQRLVNIPAAKSGIIRSEIKGLSAEALSKKNDPVGKPIISSRPAKSTSLESYDPTFVSKSAIEYETQGAIIKNVRLFNSDGELVNTVESGKRYTFSYSVLMQRDASNVGVGVLIKTFNGIEIGGAISNRIKEKNTNAYNAGEVLDVEMSFNCLLLPGVYFLNAGVRGTVDGAESYLHRIVDAFVFRVLSTEKQNLTGWIDFGFRHNVRVADANRQTKVLSRHTK